MESCVSVSRKEVVWMDCMERIMDEENDWDHNVGGNTVEGPVVCVDREKVVLALNEAPGPSDVTLELIATTGDVGIEVMAEIFL